MNRERLRQLLDAGLINRGAYIRALGQLNAGRDTVRPGIVRDQQLGARSLAVDPASRTITVVASIYGVYIPSHFMVLEDGALTPREPARANKMLIDHDQSQPVGFMSSYDPGTLATTYVIPDGDAGDRALTDAANGLRDGASVGFTITEYTFDDEGTLHVTAADWYETSLVAVPAVAGAGVTDVAAAVASTPTPTQEEHTVNRQQLAAALAAGQITQEQHDTALAVLDATEQALSARPGTPAAGQPVEADVAAGPTHDPAPAPTERLEVRPRGHNLRSVVGTLSTRANLGEIRNEQDMNLAIGEFLPAADAGEAFQQPEWLGELATITREDRPWIDAWGTPGDLTRLKAKGWRWDEEPDVAEHALDLSDVPGNNPTTEGDDYTAFGVAAAHRVQRSFIDFADPEFTQKFLEARMRRYRIKSNIGIRTRVLAAATKPTGTVTTGGVVAVLKQVVRDVRPFGGKVNRLFLADDLFEEFEDLPTGTESNLPLWLKSAGIGIDLANGSADVGQLRILNDPALTAGQVVGFDTRAGSVKEHNPIQLNVVPVSVAAVDFGFFGYLRFDDYDPRAIISRTYTAATPAAPAGE